VYRRRFYRCPIKVTKNPHYLLEAQFGMGKAEMFYYIFVAKKRKEGKINKNAPAM
jgi:hypothetical protein